MPQIQASGTVMPDSIHGSHPIYTGCVKVTKGYINKPAITV